MFLILLVQVVPTSDKSMDKLGLKIGEKKTKGEKRRLFSSSVESKEKLMNVLIFVGYTVIPILIAGFTSGYFIAGMVIRDNEYTKA